jgi:hypothetical protein
MAWKISLYQKPVGFGDRQHNFIVVGDDKGNPWAELNGGPVDQNGRFIQLDPGNLASINSRLSGGILGVDVRRFPFDPPLNPKDPGARFAARCAGNAGAGACGDQCCPSLHQRNR